MTVRYSVSSTTSMSAIPSLVAAGDRGAISDALGVTGSLPQARSSLSAAAPAGAAAGRCTYIPALSAKQFTASSQGCGCELGSSWQGGMRDASCLDAHKSLSDCHEGREAWSAWHVRSNRYHAIMQARMRYPFSGRLPSTAAGRLPSTAAGRLPSARAGRLPSARAGRLPSARAGRLPSTITGRLTFLTLLALHWRHRPLLQPCLVGWRLACSSKCRLASWPEGAEEQLARCKLLRAALRFGGKCHRYCSAR